uniref:Cleavage and polyadenylation specificity factor subunit 3 n=1 Tax=Romanomermis culicivorax TaxID=13658 RepID=A0A915J5F0_ROMCU
MPLEDEDSDQLVIKPLGAGQEVGRSCIYMQFKGKKILLDCGIHPGLQGYDALPFTDIIDIEEIDLLLITHFHLDHCGALPYFLERTAFRGRCFMTHATKAIYRMLLSDYIKVSNIGSDQMLYSEEDLEKSMEKIEVIDFHEQKEVNGVKFWCYVAGHVLGAAMFMIEIAGVKILYTGDFSRLEDRHLCAAEIPNIRPDVLIIESTYGTQIHEKREDRERRFTDLVYDIVARGGRCLIPVFALGRAQELLLILDEFWEQHPELHDIPIYYASSLAKKCMAVYQTFISGMNQRIQEQIAVNNPFIFKHISNLKSIDHFEDVGPCVVLASPGMLQSGLSRELFESWCTDSKNGCLIAGYCVEGTLAKHILSDPEEIVAMNGQKLPRRLQVAYISFSAHTDYRQTSEFIRQLKPPHVVLVHGEMNEMSRLKSAITREYEDDPQVKMDVYNPRNTQGVTLHFRGEKTAKIVGRLAQEPPHENQIISGILVKRNFNYHLMHNEDLSVYTELSQSILSQRQSVFYSGTLPLLSYYLHQLSAGEVEVMVTSEESKKKTLRVFKQILVHFESPVVIIEWIANPVNDMYADTVLAGVLQADANPIPLKNIPKTFKVDNAYYRVCLINTLKGMFGDESLPDDSIYDDHLELAVDGKTAKIDVRTCEVQCNDEQLHHMISTTTKKLFLSLAPSIR